MCNLIKGLVKREAFGYKIVAVNKRSGNYFSVAMGFRYTNRKVPKVRKQKNIGEFFLSDILEEPELFRDEMVGRTTVFLNKRDIEEYLGQRTNCPTEKLHEIKIKRAAVSIDLMEGTYYTGLDHFPIIAGRKIRFLN